MVEEASRGVSMISESSSEDAATGFAGRTASDSRARMKFLQKLSYERVWVPKAQRPPSHQTVIIFDWDDTLLCTSFLHRVQIAYMPPSVKTLLQEIEKRVIALLELALSYGQTFIITNAENGWVEHSAARYLPGLLPMLQNVHVVSARSRCIAEYPDEVSQWKTKTFLEVQRQLDSQVIANLVSLGDSHFEMDAVVAMGQEFETATIKTVKFQESPSACDLLKQQELVCKEFRRIVENATDLRVALNNTRKISRHC